MTPGLVERPRLTMRVLEAMLSALVAAEACGSPEDDHPGIDMDDMARAIAWVHWQRGKRIKRKAEASAHTEKAPSIAGETEKGGTE